MAQVQILMGVYQGTRYLEPQLQSLLDQTYRDWHLHVSDDSPAPDNSGPDNTGSDNTGSDSRALITRFFDQNTPDTTSGNSAQQVSISTGPRAGFAANYMHLLRHVHVPADGLVAFADQDDVWLPDKLARAVDMLSRSPADQSPEQPALYCARSFYWDGQDGYRASPAFRRPPAFRNALIENIAPGNTIVLNAAATRLAQAAAARVKAVFAHDWWLYQLIIGAGGTVWADNGAPVLYYRQHSDNVLGSGQGLSGQIARKLKVLSGGLSDRLDLNDDALAACRPWLSPENAQLHAAFVQARRASLPRRLARLWSLGPYRQHPLATLGFWGASLIGRA